jgi:hypothetical protein
MPAKPVVLLEGWQLLMLNNRRFQLWGYATDHPCLPGFRRHICTSRLLRLDDDQREAETLNTIYRLRHGIRDVLFDGAYPTQVLIADLTSECDTNSGFWTIRRDRTVLANDLATMTMSVLVMLAILDRQSAPDTTS